MTAIPSAKLMPLLRRGGLTAAPCALLLPWRLLRRSGLSAAPCILLLPVLLRSGLTAAPSATLLPQIEGLWRRRRLLAPPPARLMPRTRGWCLWTSHALTSSCKTKGRGLSRAKVGYVNVKLKSKPGSPHDLINGSGGGLRERHRQTHE